MLLHTIFRQCSTWYVYIHLDKSLDSDIHICICNVLSLQALLNALLWLVGCNYITKTCKIFLKNFFAFNKVKTLSEISSKQHASCYTPRRHGLQLSFHQILIMFLSNTGLHAFIYSVKTFKQQSIEF